jgi:hypothetical protein
MAKAFLTITCILMGLAFLGFCGYWVYTDFDWSRMSASDKGTVITCIVVSCFVAVIAIVHATSDTFIPESKPTERQDNIPQIKAKPGRIREVDWL